MVRKTLKWFFRIVALLLVVAAIFRKVFAPALLGILPQHSELWTAALVVTIAAGAFDVLGAIRKS